MLKWLERNDQALDEITLNNSQVYTTSTQLVSSIDMQLAKLKVLQNDINAQEQSVEKLQETGKNLIRNETTGKQTLSELKQRVQLLADNWQSLLHKLAEKHTHLNERLFESQNFQSDLQDALLWLADVESQLVNSKPFGGLPETAREQLDKFISVYNQIETNEAMITLLIQTGRKLMEKNRIEQGEVEEENSPQNEFNNNHR